MTYTWKELCDEYEDLRYEFDADNEFEEHTEENIERWRQFQELDKEVNGWLDYGPRANVEWFGEGEIAEKAKDIVQMLDWIDPYNNQLTYYIDWQKVFEDEFASEYEEITFEGDIYYFKDQA